MYQRMKEHLEGRFYEIDCVFPRARRRAAEKARCAQAIERMRAEAEDAVRAGLQPSDPDGRAHRPAISRAMPMILATGAVHSHLVRQGLRTYTSINVRAAECFDTHYFAVLIGVGATTVNAYLAQECIADRHARGLFGKLSLGAVRQALSRYGERGLLKIMSKMGISVISSYRGAYQFRSGRPFALDGGRYFPRHAEPHFRHRACRHRHANRARCMRAPSTTMRRRCRSAASTNRARAARRMPMKRRSSTCCKAPSRTIPTRPSRNIPKACGRCRPFRCAI